MKWTIGTKFSGGFIVIMLIAMGAISYFAVTGFDILANRAKASYKEDTLPLFGVLELIVANNGMEQTTFDFLASDPSKRDEKLDLYKKYQQEFTDGISKYEKEVAISSLPKTIALLNKAGTYDHDLKLETEALGTIHTFENQTPIIVQINNALNNNQEVEAKEIFLQESQRANTVKEALKTLAGLQVAQSKYTNEENYQLSSKLIKEIVAVIIISLIVGILFFYFLSRSIVRPLENLVQLIKAIIASGDVNQEITVTSSDETGELAVAFKNMTLYLKEMANIAAKIADGDLTQKVSLRSDKDIFGISFQNMITGLRKLVENITELNKSEEAKKEFIAVINHELRTPLTSLNGSIALLLSGSAGPISEKMRGLLQIANTNASRLMRLINNILEIENIKNDSMKLNFSVIDLTSLIKSIVAEMQNIASTKQIEIMFDSSKKVEINGDAEKLKQVMYNLLSNAIRFTPEGKGVSVTIEQKEDVVCVSVIDEGIGIPKEFYHRIFQKFTQADSSDTRSQDGSGLGLYISKAIIEKHGGSMHFDSVINEGTRFYFNLPIK